MAVWECPHWEGGQRKGWRRRWQIGNQKRGVVEGRPSQHEYANDVKLKNMIVPVTEIKLELGKVLKFLSLYWRIFIFSNTPDLHATRCKLLVFGRQRGRFSLSFQVNTHRYPLVSSSRLIQWCSAPLPSSHNMFPAVRIPQGQPNSWPWHPCPSSLQAHTPRQSQSLVLAFMEPYWESW